MVITHFYIELDFLRTLMISIRNLVQLLEKIGLINAMVIEENVYPNLAKVFYSNMDTSAEKQNRVMSQVGGVAIEFGVGTLNEIIGTPNEGIEIYFVRKAPYFSDYSNVEAVQNICRLTDLSDEVSTIHLCT